MRREIKSAREKVSARSLWSRWVFLLGSATIGRGCKCARTFRIIYVSSHWDVCLFVLPMGVTEYQAHSSRSTVFTILTFFHLRQHYAEIRMTQCTHQWVRFYAWWCVEFFMFHLNSEKSCGTVRSEGTHLWFLRWIRRKNKSNFSRHRNDWNSCLRTAIVQWKEKEKKGTITMCLVIEFM